MRIDGHDLPTIARAAYKFGCELGAGKMGAASATAGAGQALNAWGRVAAVTYSWCMEEYVSLSPYLYAQHAPIFFTSEGELDDETMAILASGAFDTIFFLGNPAFAPESAAETLRGAGIEVIRFFNEDAHCINGEINAWLTKQNAEGGADVRMASNDSAGDGYGADNTASDKLIDFSHMIVCSTKSTYDAYAGCAYAGKIHAAFLLEDPTNLDSIDKAVSCIRDFKGEVKHLTFLGGDAVFNSLDKEILGKALTQELPAMPSEKAPKKKAN